MINWSKLPLQEIERRRQLSISADARLEQGRFDAWYQKKCDQLYWDIGPCCAGCDHWRSGAGMIGRCSASGIVSGADVQASMGMDFCSRQIPPGFPQTKAEDVCGKFKDEFDWLTLDKEYLVDIGYKK